MLFMSFLALVASCVLLWLEWKERDTAERATAQAAHQIYSQPAELTAYTVCNELYRS